MKYSFQNDYGEGGHPWILERLQATNLVQQSGYGEDDYSRQAKELIKKQLDNPAAVVYFVSGGTQANLLVISSLLLPHEGVISADTGHIFTHEAGAIEAVGHRIIAVASKDGKITPDQIKQVMETYAMRPHMTKPGMVYISNSTELGSIYTKAELKALQQVCRQHQLYLFMDGARLGAALTASHNDMEFSELADLVDVFYIGGTKNGALLGEAVVFNDPQTVPHFDYMLKQKGALLAKGRVLGIQFLTLFTDNLFFELAQKANDLAMYLAKELQAQKIEFLLPPETNQLFPILSNNRIERLKKDYRFHEWQKIDSTHTAIRLVVSWATPQAVIDEFIKDLYSNTDTI